MAVLLAVLVTVAGTLAWQRPAFATGVNMPSGSQADCNLDIFSGLGVNQPTAYWMAGTSGQRVNTQIVGDAVCQWDSASQVDPYPFLRIRAKTAAGGGPAAFWLLHFDTEHRWVPYTCDGTGHCSTNPTTDPYVYQVDVQLQDYRVSGTLVFAQIVFNIGPVAQYDSPGCGLTGGSLALSAAIDRPGGTSANDSSCNLYDFSTVNTTYDYGVESCPQRYGNVGGRLNPDNSTQVCHPLTTNAAPATHDGRNVTDPDPGHQAPLPLFDPAAPGQVCSVGGVTAGDQTTNVGLNGVAPSPQPAFSTADGSAGDGSGGSVVDFNTSDTYEFHFTGLSHVAILTLNLGDASGQEDSDVQTAIYPGDHWDWVGHFRHAGKWTVSWQCSAPGGSERSGYVASGPDIPGCFTKPPAQSKEDAFQSCLSAAFQQVTSFNLLDPSTWLGAATAALNPVTYAKATVCTLQFLFVPSSFDDRVGQMSAAFNSSGASDFVQPFTVVKDAVGTVTGASSGDCDGPGMTVPLAGGVSVHPLSACSGASATLADVLRTALSIGVYVGAAFVIYKMLAGLIGGGGGGSYVTGTAETEGGGEFS